MHAIHVHTHSILYTETSIERELTDEIAFDDVIEEFANKKSRKIAL